MNTRIHKTPGRATLHFIFWNSPRDALVDRKTVAAGLCLSTNFLEQKALTGGFAPFVKIGRKCFYSKRAVLAWVQETGRVFRTTSDPSPKQPSFDFGGD